MSVSRLKEREGKGSQFTDDRKRKEKEKEMKSLVF
jgi:hypothetical protein